MGENFPIPYQVEGLLLKLRITFCLLDAVAASFLWHSLRRLTRPMGRAHTFPRARDQPKQVCAEKNHGTTEHTENTDMGYADMGYDRDIDGEEEKGEEHDGTVEVEAGLPVPEVVLSGVAGFGDVYPAWLWDRVPAREVVVVAEVLEQLMDLPGMNIHVRARPVGWLDFEQLNPGGISCQCLKCVENKIDAKGMWT